MASGGFSKGFMVTFGVVGALIVVGLLNRAINR